ncbi:hypothetical protein KSS87_000079 [Heliosperma pusillum]|nr:hypothetical protein KSS87_004751 [Heliosperma pusillum]KAH9614558.1 hypothetical protein KSS87_000079 [Heliosperma pusillum]
MDVFEVLQELHKESAVDTLRRPLVRAEKSNGITTNARHSRTREVSSRHKSPTAAPSTTTNSRRCPSPNLTRSVNASSAPLGSTKRAFSAERKRPSTPPSPSRPSTPVSDTSVDSLSSSRKVAGSKLPEVLWPSTMRRLSVSFQSDSISIPVSKKEKVVSHVPSDRTLKPSSNVAHRQAEINSGPRKPTPERKRSPLKVKSPPHQSENSRPVDGAQARLIDQHRWPSRTGGKLSASMLTKSVDLSDTNKGKIPNFINHPISGLTSLRRFSSEGIPRVLQKTSIDHSQQSEFEDHISALGLRMKAVDDSLIRGSTLQKVIPGTSVRSSLLPVSRMASPSRASVSRGTPSPAKTRPSTPTQSRGTSPSRIRQSSPTRQSSNTTSVLSFVADIKKGKKTNQLEDAHQLRLLHNRQLQWRFAKARADTALFIQKISVEETLYNVWETNLELWDSVLRKRIELQQLNLDLKLDLVLGEQMTCLEDWVLLDEDLSSSLNGVIEDLEASTLRLPVSGGAKADIDSLKIAISSAADVMQMMGSSICSLLSKAEAINGLVSELAELAGHERALLNECDDLLTSSAAAQVSDPFLPHLSGITKAIFMIRLHNDFSNIQYVNFVSES